MKKQLWIAALSVITLGLGLAPLTHSANAMNACEPNDCLTVNGCSIECARCRQSETLQSGTCEWP